MSEVGGEPKEGGRAENLGAKTGLKSRREGPFPAVSKLEAFYTRTSPGGTDGRRRTPALEAAHRAAFNF